MQIHYRYSQGHYTDTTDNMQRHYTETLYRQRHYTDRDTITKKLYRDRDTIQSQRHIQRQDIDNIQRQRKRHCTWTETTTRQNIQRQKQLIYRDIIQRQYTETDTETINIQRRR